MPVSFTQSCPTCGRRVQVRASLVGYTVVCQHCRAEFDAKLDSEIHLVSRGNNLGNTEEPQMEPEADPLMMRVEEVLKRAAAQTPIA
jgi:transcription elongation factor Elf1